MYRFVPLLILMLLVAVAALAGGQYGNHSAQLFLPQNQALVANIDCIDHEAAVAGPSIMLDCDTTKPCSNGKLCHVCPHGALLAHAGSATSILTPLYIRPPHSAVAWLSAEYAPDFKPPIL